MPVFSYKALNPAGDTLGGQIRAPSKTVAMDMILSSGRTPTRLTQVQDTPGARSWLKREAAPLNVAATGAFARDLARLLSSGFSLHQALQMVSASTESKGVRALAETAASHVNTGGKLSDVLSRETGSPVKTLAGLVKAGEASGELQTILGSAGDSFERSAEFREKLTSALIYPMIILFMISLTLIVFFSLVLPRLAPLFEDVGDRLPLATKLLLGFGEWTEVWLPVIGVGCLAGFIMLRLNSGLKSRVTRWWHSRLIGRLGLGGPRLAGYAAYARTLGLLLGSGLPLYSANDIAARSLGNSALSGSLSNISAGLREGLSLTARLEGLSHVPDILVRMSAVGEQTGKLGAALIDAAGILERKAQTRTDRLLAALTPAITILLGLLVTGVLGSLFLGIASLTDVQI